VDELATRLADATRRLGELEVGQLAVRASFDVSLHTLQESPDPTEQAATAVFGLLSLPDGPDLSLAAAAMLLDLPEPATERLLERLVDAQLLETPRPGRYQFHDLVGLYAREHAVRQHPEPDRLAALARLFGFYVATTWHTLALLLPGNPRLASADPRWTRSGLRLPEALAALAWLEAERTNLLAAVTQAAATPTIPTGLAGQLTRALFGFFLVRSYPKDAIHANQAILRIARRDGDRRTKAHALNDLGVTHRRLGQYAEALACHQGSGAIFEELGDHLDHANVLDNLGLVFERLGRYAEGCGSVAGTG
jgi:tetratricopeptide (TPR) repeat protein